MKKIVYKLNVIVSVPGDGSGIGDLLERIREDGAVDITDVQLMTESEAEKLITDFLKQ